MFRHEGVKQLSIAFRSAKKFSLNIAGPLLTRDCSVNFQHSRLVAMRHRPKNKFAIIDLRGFLQVILRLPAINDYQIAKPNKARSK
jgi:hypothetical protein